MLRYRKVLSSVKPGYLRPLLPTEAPNDPENWKDVMTDVEKLIMPGVSTKYTLTTSRDIHSKSRTRRDVIIILLCSC